MTPAEEARHILELAGVDCDGGRLVSYSPIDGKPIGRVTTGDPEELPLIGHQVALHIETPPKEGMRDEG